MHFLLDFSRPLPFADESFDGVFCEHVLEHFSLEDGGTLAREIHRVLRRGGCIRIVVPDARLVLRRYFEAPSDLVAGRGERGDETPMEIVNTYFRQRYEHQFLYDWTTLSAMLSDAGFPEAQLAAFGQAKLSPSIVVDDQKYAWESLYVEALKP